MARNCQPVNVVTREEMQITAAIARKYGEEITRRMLWCRFRGPVSPVPSSISCPPPTAACPLRQIRITNPAQIKMKSTIPTSKLSVPKTLVIVLEK